MHKLLRSTVSRGRLIQACLFLTFSILFLIFFLPIAFGVVHTGTVFGTFVCLLAVLCTVFPKQLLQLIRFAFGNKIIRIFASLFALFIAAGIIVAIIITFFMIKECCFNVADGSESVAVVLGCKINGTTPSKMLKSRLDKAYIFLTEHPDMPCVVSGGQGEDEVTSEASVMKDYLVNLGISSDRIYVEDKSSNTYDNILFSSELAEEKELDGNSIAVVTDGFHQLRAGLIADELGIKHSSVSASTVWYLFLPYYVREWFGVVERVVLK